MLLREMPQYSRDASRFSADIHSQRRLLRSLMNIRPPMPLSFDFLSLQDELLSAERDEKGVVDVMTLPIIKDPRIVLWRGDITRLNADVIVNAANNTLLGCFVPCHGCIDNAIHSAAGLQLRDECNQIMSGQGYVEPTGKAKLTKAYNLPCKRILHTVGPIIQMELGDFEFEQLASCYSSCLKLTADSGFRVIAFCCISTGEFHFPNKEAARIAIHTVMNFLTKNEQVEKVVFVVFTDTDQLIYQNLLSN
jgi:O-acetyl-ADP-ribose deacetylase (regulator of RNase III)